MVSYHRIVSENMATCSNLSPCEKGVKSGPLSARAMCAIAHCVVKDSVDKTQKEIMEEMARALGHCGHQLESILEQLKELDALMCQTQGIEEYNALVEKFNELLKLALTRREMLMIHREALGVFKHTYIDIFYPIPEKKRKKT
jgi:hypothetical protein